MKNQNQITAPTSGAAIKLPAKVSKLHPEALDFVPGLLAIQEQHPARLPKVFMYTIMTLFVVLLAWGYFGRLDIVTSAEGQLIPESYVKIVQPANDGIVEKIFVAEGDRVEKGQVLLRMDHHDSDADGRALQTQLNFHALQLRRINAELSNNPLERLPGDNADLWSAVSSQFNEHRNFYVDGLATTNQNLVKATHDFDVALQTHKKLQNIVPILREEASSYAEMAKDGYIPQATMREKQRDYLERDGDLKAQDSVVASALDSKRVAAQQVAQFMSKYRSDLQNERVDAEQQLNKVTEELNKQRHKLELLDLRSPQTGFVKDLAVHTSGTVVSPGSILLSVVPENERLVVEAYLKNEDIGFIHVGQAVKVKLIAYPFQKYGLLEGKVTKISADVTDDHNSKRSQPQGDRTEQNAFKLLVILDKQKLVSEGESLALTSGMQAIVEVDEGKRSVFEYLFSPVKKVFAEGGRER